MNLADLREDYTKGGISRADLPADPFEQFHLGSKLPTSRRFPKPMP